MITPQLPSLTTTDRFKRFTITHCQERRTEHAQKASLTMLGIGSGRLRHSIPLLPIHGISIGDMTASAIGSPRRWSQEQSVLANRVLSLIRSQITLLVTATMLQETSSMKRPVPPEPTHTLMMEPTA